MSEVLRVIFIVLLCIESYFGIGYLVLFLIDIARKREDPFDVNGINDFLMLLIWPVVVSLLLIVKFVNWMEHYDGRY